MIVPPIHSEERSRVESEQKDRFLHSKDAQEANNHSVTADAELGKHRRRVRLTGARTRAQTPVVSPWSRDRSRRIFWRAKDFGGKSILFSLHSLVLVWSKDASWSSITLCISVIDSSMSVEDSTPRYVKLVSAEGHEFFVERSIAIQSSKTIKLMLEGQFREASSNTITFPDIAGYILERVVRYFN